MELHMKLWCLNKGKKLTARVFAKNLILGKDSENSSKLWCFGVVKKFSSLM